jgi:hypothetical protein
VEKLLVVSLRVPKKPWEEQPESFVSFESGDEDEMPDSPESIYLTRSKVEERRAKLVVTGGI